MKTIDKVAKLLEIKECRDITIDDIEELPGQFVPVKVAALYENRTPYMNIAYRYGKLPYPCYESGNRLKIPKATYVAYFRGELPAYAV
jgi:hypothetical protein